MKNIGYIAFGLAVVLILMANGADNEFTGFGYFMALLIFVGGIFVIRGSRRSIIAFTIAGIIGLLGVGAPEEGADGGKQIAWGLISLGLAIFTFVQRRN